MKKSFPAQVELLRTILQWILEDLSFLPTSLLHKIELASEEAIVNIIQHAYQGRPEEIEIEVKVVDGRCVEVTFKDNGPPFNPTKHIYQEDGERVGGVGIHLMRQNMDEVRYRREGNKNVLTLVKWITHSSQKK